MSSSSLDAQSDATSPSSASTDAEPSGVGLSNPQLSIGRRRLLDLINRLASTGASVDIDLPQIAVVGSQSAGKSSLIESISGITLPRAVGTCTRCPTECKLSRSTDPWKCAVSLRFIKDKTGKVGSVRNETFGGPIYHKSEVEDRIRRAQLAILNPSKTSTVFLGDEGDNNGGDAELSFSSNCVSLQISGPDVADLSFCDLPGLIASVSDNGNEADIALVQSLVTSYIERPSCIILLTVACETDFENQGAHRLVKANDPHGKRTIGVLTKPDRIPAGEEDGWLKFIRNEKEPLENNWYCVKQPSSSTLKKGISWAEARAQEDLFFSTTAPWSDLESTYQSYLRTRNLTDRLSVILSDLISKRLPEIQQELENQLQKTQDSLHKLPKEPTNDPFSEILHLIHGFTDDLGHHLEGVPDEDGLIQAIRPKHNGFRRVIRATAPDFRPYERRFAAQRSLPYPTFLDNEDEVDMEMSQVPTDDGDDDDDNDEREPIYIDEVMDRAHSARTRELPGNYPFVVQKSFIAAVTQRWNTPAKRLCDSVHNLVNAHVRTIVNKHFSKFKTGGLESRVKFIMSEHVKRAAQSAEEKIDWLVFLEDQPFTLNTHYFVDYKEKFISYYRGNRNRHTNKGLVDAIDNPDPLPTIHNVVPGNAYPSTHNSYTTLQVPVGIPAVKAGLAQVGLHGVKRTDLLKLLSSDVMDPAISIMADVRAYFQVAYKRFADNIPLAIDHELVLGLKTDMQAALYAGLGINGKDALRVCKELLAEDPRVALQRDELLKKQERLYAATQELLRIGF